MSRQISFNAEAALDIYLSSPEIGTREIIQIFNCGSSSAWKLKQKAIAVMKERGKETLFANNVNTKCAYEAWGIDVSDLERMILKRRKLNKEVTT